MSDTNKERESVVIDFSQVGTAGPFPVVNGRVQVPDVTMLDLARMLKPTSDALAAPVRQSAGVTDEQIIALNAGERFFSESPTKYPEAGHGTQYHAGAPGVIGFARAVLELAQPQPEPTSKGEPVSEEIAAMLGERVAFLRDPAVYRGKYWDSMTNEQRKQAFTKLDGGAAGYAKKFWTWRHFDMAAEDIGMPPPAAGDPGSGRGRLAMTEHEALIANLREAAQGMGEDNYTGWKELCLRAAQALSATQEAGKVEAVADERMRHIANEWADMATNGLQWLRNIRDGISKVEDAVANMEGNMEHCRQVNDATSQPEPTSKVEAVADERQPSDGDYLRWAEQAGAKVNWDFESASSARVVFLTASQWGRFCDKVRALYLRPSQQALSDEAKDALRYRWLREVWPMTLLEDLLQKSVGLHPSAELDKAIDSAILAAASGSKGGGE